MKETEIEADQAMQHDDYNARGKLPWADAGAGSVSGTKTAAHQSPTQVLLPVSELCLTHGLAPWCPGTGSYFALVYLAPGDSSLSLMSNPTIRAHTVLTGRPDVSAPAWILTLPPWRPHQKPAGHIWALQLC